MAIAEMNLEEYPAFRLGRRSKRQELRYTRTRSDAEGRTLEQVWVVRGVEGLGLPGPFEQDLYVALLVLFTEQGLPADGRIRFTRNRLAQVMGCSNSGRGYELLEQGLSRLAGASIHTEHAFYRLGTVGPGGERTSPAERLSLDFHILEEVRVYERRTLVEDPPSLATVDTSRPRVEHARPLELSLARLGQPLVQSYERRYTKGLDATFYFALERPLAKRLYRYLDKVRNGRGSFEIGLLALADVLGLEYRYPSDVKDGLDDAHAELQTTGYLATTAYAPLAGARGPVKAGGAGEKVVYGIHPLFDRRPRRRAGAAQPAGALGHIPTNALGQGKLEPPALEAAVDEPLTDAPPLHAHAAPLVGVRVPPTQQVTHALPLDALAVPEKSPLQAELESFGITPARAAALVVAHPEGHIAARIAYVRELRRRPGATPLKNPAGYLARAITESYALPEPPPAAGLSSPAPRPEPILPETPDALPQVKPEETPAEISAEKTPAEASEETSAEQSEDGAWGQLMLALKERLSAATYAAWVLPAAPASPADTATPTPQEKTGTPTTMAVVLPSAFAIERWRRPPVSTALAEAATALHLSVVLQLGETPPGVTPPDQA